MNSPWHKANPLTLQRPKLRVRQIVMSLPDFASRHRCRPLSGALRRFAGHEPLMSALSVLSVAVSEADGSREASISVQSGRISTTIQSQVVCNECIQTAEVSVQEASFSAMTEPSAGDVCLR